MTRVPTTDLNAVIEHRSMRASAFLIVPTILAASYAACRNDVIVPASSLGSGGGSSVLVTDSSGANPVEKDAGKDAFPDYVDPGCPTKPPPMEDFQCDASHQGNGDCNPNEGCYIFVQYPTNPCGQETYGSRCLPAGTGQQGDACTGPQACSAGHACVVTGSGTQCTLLCPLTGPSGCPSGFVCEAIDVAGFGGCL